MTMAHRFAIFGGTFDPFTPAHEAIAKKVILDARLADTFFIAPTITNWYRNKNDLWLNDEQRVELCKLAAKKISLVCPLSAVKCWAFDVYRKYSFPEGQIRDDFVKSWHYIDTLCDLRSSYNASGLTDWFKTSDNKWYTVIGADQLKFFKNWHRWEDILKLSTLVVVNGRNGETVESDIPHIDIQIDQSFENVSATKIRNEFRGKENGFEEYKKMFEV